MSSFFAFAELCLQSISLSLSLSFNLVISLGRYRCGGNEKVMKKIKQFAFSHESSLFFQGILQFVIESWIFFLKIIWGERQQRDTKDVLKTFEGFFFKKRFF
jgi:hypothetical protein